MEQFDLKSFFFDEPLYSKIVVKSIPEFIGLLDCYNKRIEAYNPSIKENSTFVVSYVDTGYTHLDRFISDGGVVKYALECVRTEEIFLFYAFYDTRNKVFQKIGQLPSLATLHISQVKQYDKVLDKDRIKEFTRAIGLAANGIGIGSFVYLRRIFEGLIEDAHREAVSLSEWDEERFKKERMPEKIDMLKFFLPSFLVEHKSLYGILSVGVHALKEEECLAYFETVKMGIELILDDKVEVYEKNKKLKEASDKIKALTQSVKTKSK